MYLVPSYHMLALTFSKSKYEHISNQLHVLISMHTFRNSFSHFFLDLMHRSSTYFFHNCFIKGFLDFDILLYAFSFSSPNSGYSTFLPYTA